MEQLAVGVWRSRETSASDCHSALRGDWAEEVLAVNGVGALTVNVADVDQGIYTRDPDVHGLVPNADALLVLGLERAHDLDDLPARDVLHHVARRVEVWRVISHLRKGDAPEALPAATPGVKFVSFMRRAERLSHEQFVRHWTERHTPMALEHHVGLWRYTQHVVRRAYTPGGGNIDGIAELHFRTRTDFEQRFFDSDAGRRAILDDVATFMRRDGSEAAMMTEHVLRA